MTTSAPSRNAAPGDLPTITWNVLLADVGTVTHEGRLKLDEGWLIITDRDENGNHYVVFAAPSESVIFVAPVD